MRTSVKHSISNRYLEIKIYTRVQRLTNMKLVGILLLTTYRFIGAKLLLRGQPLIERLLEPTSSRLRLVDTYCTTVTFIQIMHNPAYLVHHGSTTAKHLKCKVRQHQTQYCRHHPHDACDIDQTRHPFVSHATDSKASSSSLRKLDFTSVMNWRRFGRDE